MSSSEWEKKQLGELVTFQRGYDLSKSQFTFGKYPIAGSNGIIGYHNEFSTKGPSITIGRSGNLGTPYFYQVDFWAHNTTLFVKEFHNTDPKFIYYLLQTLDLTQFNSGSAVPSLNRNYIHPLIVNAPKSIETQRRIADILSALDEKIELNRQSNVTLENIAQTIFKEWFVNFNYPLSEPGFEGLQDYHDYAAALKLGTQLNQGNHANQENHGADMLESELGPIPKGWRVGKLGDVCILMYGKGLKSENRVDGEYPVIGSSGIVGSHNVFLVEGPGIVIGRKGTIGEVIWVQQNFCPIDTTFYIKDALGLEDLYFHYFLLKEQNFKKIGSDSAVPGLNREQAQSNVIIIPSSDVINYFNEIVKPLFNSIFNINQQSRTLATIRDTLLPKLMSGEIKV